MSLSRHRNAGQNYDMRIANKSFENVARFRYLGTKVIYQNLILEEISRILHSGNVCYQSVQNIFSCPLSKNKN
jgi:hypothetical protein